MIRKLSILTLVAATFLSLGTALAQNKAGKVNFYEVVPKHEFFFEGFGGFAPLFYDVTTYNLNFAGTAEPETVGAEAKSTLWPWESAKWLEKEEFMKFPVGIGYGGGFGYIAHITPTVGIMTGVEAAMYHGGINLVNEDAARAVWTAGVVDDGRRKVLRAIALENYYEMQQYLAVQVPLMLHLMAPMGKGNNFFYAAFGAKVGFNVYGNFQGKGEAAYASNLPYSETWDETVSAGNLFGSILMTGTATSTRPSGPKGYGESINAFNVDGKFSENGGVEISGPYKTNLINAMASAEIGFRWKFGRGCGLYTGLYADLGFLPMTSNKTGEAIQGEEGPYQSITVSGGLPTYYFRDEAGVPKAQYMNEALPKAAKGVYSMHAGLKMKIAFGKAKKHVAVPAVVLPPKPDTVVKTVVQTVVVRDTVVQNNTVVVRDTVEKVNTVVVRDTVVVIKEVPQEIKDVMVELSNTLFAFNKFNLTDKAKAGLDKVAKWLNDNPDVQCEISGHTDSVGSDSYNQKLSEDRAKSVYEYFIHEGGVSSKRLSYKGYGKTRPIATNDTEEGRQQNRRVELNIIQ